MHFPFLSIREMRSRDFAAHVARISFTGELGYEIWVGCGRPGVAPRRACWRRATISGSSTSARALHSLRLEKSFGNWAREYRPIYTPAEAGLDRFVDLAKPDFIGRAAVARDQVTGPARRLATFVVGRRRCGRG